MLIDARGMGCPKPVIMAEKSLSQIQEGSIEVLVDNEASVSNLLRFANKNGFYADNTKQDNYWCVKIIKGYPCEITPQKPETEPVETSTSSLKPSYFLVVATDTIGKEEGLGKILMKGFFETMRITKEVPHTIFFLNAGVKLTTVDEEIVSIIKDIEAMGVEIFSCGTCLKHYGIETELKVGYRGTTNHIIEGINDSKKTVWIG